MAFAKARKVADRPFEQRNLVHTDRNREGFDMNIMANIDCKQPLLTLGYEKTDIDSYVRKLVDAEVEILIDRPQSRKKGFSKNGLRAAVECVGIDYLHVRELGDPKPGRDAARAGDHDLFVSIFTEHINGDAAQAAMKDLADTISGRVACLLCFEKEHHTCHRSIVADQLSDMTGAPIIHLTM